MGCYSCGRPIPVDEPYLSIDYHLERYDGEMTVTVDHAESLMTDLL